MTNQRQKYYVINLIIICLLWLNGCNSSRIKTESAVIKTGFQNQWIETEYFNLFASIKINDEVSENIVFYIEGDGHAWKHKNKLSDNPTPKNPISLKLALSDSKPNVVYLARPCQYLEENQLKDCSPRYWSSHRYAEEVIVAMSQAITKIKTQSNATIIDLIGYSGGGVIAMLVASRRNDVRSIITMASNIDHESWSEWHGVSKLNGSITPLNFLEETKNIEQLHLWGGKDKIVPFKTQISFVAHSKNNPLIKYEIIPEFTHDCCWLEYWQNATNH